MHALEAPAPTAPAPALVAPHNEQFFELPGSPPIHAWAQACTVEGCPCRDLLVLGSPSREALLTHVAQVRASGLQGLHAAEGGTPLMPPMPLKDEEEGAGVEYFMLNVELGLAYWRRDGEPVNCERQAVLAIAGRLEGERLDELRKCWIRGRGHPDPEERVQSVKSITVRGWEPGMLIAFDQLVNGVRADLYAVVPDLHGAHELYCPNPSCDCGAVMVDFVDHNHNFTGHVAIEPSAAPQFNPEKGRDAELAQLWQAYEKRHPRYRERFARRYELVRCVGDRMVAGGPVKERPLQRATAKIGRNDPCPCGSGQKFKKCCGAKSAS